MLVVAPGVDLLEYWCRSIRRSVSRSIVRSVGVFVGVIVVCSGVSMC